MTAALPVPLAHAGTGATWQALLALVGIGLVLVVILAVTGVVTMETPGDLILPLAAVAILASLSGAATSTLSDWIWWAFPIGVVSLVGLVIASTTPLDIGGFTNLLVGIVVLSALSVLIFDAPITRAWHPVPLALDIQTYPAGDLKVQLVSLDEGDTVPAGDLSLKVKVSGGTFVEGPTTITQDGQARLPDPAEDGYVQVFVDGVAIFDDDGAPLRPDEDCSAGCTTATFTIRDVAAGTHRAIIELRAADRLAFSPSLFQQAQFTAQ